MTEPYWVTAMTPSARAEYDKAVAEKKSSSSSSSSSGSSSSGGSSTTSTPSGYWDKWRDKYGSSWWKEAGFKSDPYASSGSGSSSGSGGSSSSGDKTAYYDSKKGGIVTSDGKFFPSSNPAWIPEGYKGTGSSEGASSKSQLFSSGQLNVYNEATGGMTIYQAGKKGFEQIGFSKPKFSTTVFSGEPGGLIPAGEDDKGNQLFSGYESNLLQQSFKFPEKFTMEQAVEYVSAKEQPFIEKQEKQKEFINLILPDKSVAFTKSGYGVSIDPSKYAELTKTGGQLLKWSPLTKLPTKSETTDLTPEQIAELDLTWEQQRMIEEGYMKPTQTYKEFGRLLNVEPTITYNLEYTDKGKTWMAGLEKESLIDVGSKANWQTKWGSGVTGSIRALSLAIEEERTKPEQSLWDSLKRGQYQATAEGMLATEQAMKEGYKKEITVPLVNWRLGEINLAPGKASALASITEQQVFGSIAGQTLLNIGILKGTGLAVKGIGTVAKVVPSTLKYVPGISKIIPSVSKGTMSGLKLAGGLGLTAGYLGYEGYEGYRTLQEKPSAEKYAKLISQGIRLGVFVPEIYMGLKPFMKEVGTKIAGKVGASKPSVKYKLVETKGEPGKTLYEATLEKGQVTYETQRGLLSKVKQVKQIPIRETIFTTEKPALSVPTESRKIVQEFIITPEGRSFSVSKTTGMPEYFGGVPKVKNPLLDSVFTNIPKTQKQFMIINTPSGKPAIIETNLNFALTRTPKIVDGNLKWVFKTAKTPPVKLLRAGAFIEPPRLLLDVPTQSVSAKGKDFIKIIQTGEGAGYFKNVVTVDKYTKVVSAKDFLPQLEDVTKPLFKKTSNVPLYPPKPTQTLWEQLGINKLGVGEALVVRTTPSESYLFNKLNIRPISQPKYVAPKNVFSVSKMSDYVYQQEIAIASGRRGTGQVYEGVTSPTQPTSTPTTFVNAVVGVRKVGETFKPSFDLVRAGKPGISYTPTFNIFGTTLGTTLSQKIDITSGLKTDVGLKTSTLSIGDLKIKQAEEVDIIQKPRQDLAIISISKVDTTTDTTTDTKVDTALDTRLDTKTYLGEEIRMKEKEIILPFGLALPGQDRVKKQQKQRAYQSYIKERGKYKPIGKPTSQSEALDLGAEYVDRTPSARFKIEPTNRKPINNPSVSRGYFNNNKQKFRGYKIKKGSKVPMKQEYIEFERYRIDRPSERKGITARGTDAVRIKKLKRLFG